MASRFSNDPRVLGLGRGDAFVDEAAMGGPAIKFRIRLSEPDILRYAEHEGLSYESAYWRVVEHEAGHVRLYRVALERAYAGDTDLLYLFHRTQGFEPLVGAWFPG